MKIQSMFPTSALFTNIRCYYTFCYSSSPGLPDCMWYSALIRSNDQVGQTQIHQGFRLTPGQPAALIARVRDLHKPTAHVCFSYNHPSNTEDYSPIHPAGQRPKHPIQINSRHLNPTESMHHIYSFLLWFGIVTTANCKNILIHFGIIASNG